MPLSDVEIRLVIVCGNTSVLTVISVSAENSHQVNSYNMTLIKLIIYNVEMKISHLNLKG